MGGRRTASHSAFQLSIPDKRTLPVHALQMILEDWEERLRYNVEDDGNVVWVGLDIPSLWVCR